MKILLVEDEQIHCEKYIECIQYLPYTATLSIANGCERGIELIQEVRPDVILLDLELQEGDGDGIMLLNQMNELKLKVNPYVIVITANTSRRSHRTARECGADYIFPKNKPDYSPRLLLDFAHNYFINLANNEACNASADDAEDKESRIRTKISSDIEKISITSKISGRDYIIDAILIILNLYENKINACDIHLSSHVYPVIARKYRKSEKTVEQSIRNAIKRAWNKTDPDTAAENYTAYVSDNYGAPESREFIFYYVNKYEKEFFGA